MCMSDMQPNCDDYQLDITALKNIQYHIISRMTIQMAILYNANFSKSM